VAVRGNRIEHEVYIAASPHEVFAMFTEPELYIRWMGREATLDPRPGGTYRCVVHDSATIVGEYVVVDPPHRVDFTWGFEGNPRNPPGSSLVSVTITPDADGTLLRLIHTGLEHPSLDSHDRGWAGYLKQLTAVTRYPRGRLTNGPEH
jgi:uncharacterized protein YndB with AHSA1/START domain